jgi:hypothetical protein
MNFLAKLLILSSLGLAGCMPAGFQKCVDGKLYHKDFEHTPWILKVDPSGKPVLCEEN